MATTRRSTSDRGFASMDEKKQHEIASKGGKSVPPEERSFSKDHAAENTSRPGLFQQEPASLKLMATEVNVEPKCSLRILQ